MASLDEFTGFAIYRKSETAERDILKMYRHYRGKAIKLLDFGLNTFGPQADMKAATDGSRQVSEGVVNLDGQAVLDGGVMMAGGLLGILAPGNYSQYKPASDEAADAVLAACKKQAEQVLESKAIDMYNPPEVDERHLSYDPLARTRAAESAARGVDMEGRPLVAGVVAGRAPGSGKDRPVTASDLGEVSKGVTGREISEAEQPFWESGRAGSFVPEKSASTEKGISISPGLTEAEWKKVAGHEVGHAIDDVAGGIDASGLDDELERIYSIGSSGKDVLVGRRTPGHFGYPADQWKDEQMAEAIRFYLLAPDWMRSHAPKTARRIRDYVNENESLKAVIQFNSIAATIGLPLMLRDDEGDGS